MSHWLLVRALHTLARICSVEGVVAVHRLCVVGALGLCICGTSTPKGAFGGWLGRSARLGGSRIGMRENGFEV